jgi:hypothetical protein
MPPVQIHATGQARAIGVLTHVIDISEDDIGTCLDCRAGIDANNLYATEVGLEGTSRINSIGVELGSHQS